MAEEQIFKLNNTSLNSGELIQKAIDDPLDKISEKVENIINYKDVPSNFSFIENNISGQSNIDFSNLFNQKINILEANMPTAVGIYFILKKEDHNKKVFLYTLYNGNTSKRIFYLKSDTKESIIFQKSEYTIIFNGWYQIDYNNLCLFKI